MSKTRYRILSFDPGITETGWAVIDYNKTTGHMTVSAYDYFNRAYLANKRKEMQKTFLMHYVLLDAYYDTVCDLIDHYKPDEVVCEGGFAHKFIKAYESLVLVIHKIRTASDKKLGKDIHIVAPQEAKLWITGTGTASKTSVTESVSSYKDLTIKSNKQRNIQKMPNHVFDAIALGVTFIQKILVTRISAKTTTPAK